MIKKLNLTIEDLEDRIAPSLILPNGKEIFAGFDNPAPNDTDSEVCKDFDACHPALNARADTALTATTGHGPSVTGFGNEGPWSATVKSPVIGFSNG